MAAPASTPIPVVHRLRDAGIAGLVAMALAVPFLGLRTVNLDQGLVVQANLAYVPLAGAIVFLGRLVLGLLAAPLAKAAAPLAAWRPPAAAQRLRPWGGPLLILAAVALPFLPFANRYVIDLGTTALIYILLATGLNITVGLAGLLDLGFAAFYAIGAYTCALTTTQLHWGFWPALVAGGLASSLFAVLLSLPILRLRGDYLAIVTLGFGEITRIVILNWQGLTGGPNGVSGIARPTLFGLTFDRRAPAGGHTFSEVTGIAYAPEHRLIFLYLLILALTVLAAYTVARLRRLPIGRAWEALREDEIACRSLGINPTMVKVSAYATGALMGGLAGCFFAARQGFVSPESFGFMESATILAIVVLGGMGSQAGVIIAALFIVVLPELARGFADYRMLAFGLAMILIMIWKPGGLLSGRLPTIRLSNAKPKSVAETA
ncbi:high-affinity branched-chain amino acid ABC transporter permease LivM [Nitrospirillum amazonense]|uniref:high-affinity branched-chain amino acid ABC transporter permease LivM n=1 Tax=Nitrospirillum amazonense TaxID=28077 RepID=UPI0024125192|nr:high-affinity branched-chain amino acid ABC transporter permease LivM [Nitrospirillum amazonense]MDG3442014.1 high-affinity branched-chain amino acid ABC transporter permease LivM [Nitrospirillum amazonense]